MAAGCDDFVRKPYREDEIFGIMEKQLGLKYVYLDEQNGEEPVVIVSELTLEQLIILPEEILIELYQATLRLDTARLSVLIEQTINTDISIGSTMKRLYIDMDYSGLLAFLEEIITRRRKYHEES